MARQIAPGTPSEINAKLVDIKMPSFDAFDKLGDAKIKAANQNFKLYAKTLLTTESGKLYEQFKTNPIELSNALGKLPEMLKGLPEEIQTEMTAKFLPKSIALVQKAEQNHLVAQDMENKQNADLSINQNRSEASLAYQNVLQNHISKAEDKNPVMNDVFLQSVMGLNDLADLRNYQGKNVYSETQRKAIRNIDDLELDGFKQFFDTMILNDNDKLEESKNYYTKFMLAPERFMSENYMNRDTYDKALAYAKKELKRAGADIQKATFNQSIREATELQVADLPGKIASLKESGILDKSLIKNIEKVNVKFNEIDPSKAESPVAMINLLQIVNSWKSNPAPKTEAEQQKILEQGTATLDAIADYAQTYGLSPKNVQSIRETVVNMETNTAFAPVLQNFGDIIDNFDSKLKTVRYRATGKGYRFGNFLGDLTGIDGMSNEEEIKMIKLNNLLAIATDQINAQIRNGDWEGVRKTQREVQKQAARLKEDWVDWELADSDKDAVFLRNGQYVKPKSHTENGDIIFEKVK